MLNVGEEEVVDEKKELICAICEMALVVPSTKSIAEEEEKSTGRKQRQKGKKCNGHQPVP